MSASQLQISSRLGTGLRLALPAALAATILWLPSHTPLGMVNGFFYIPLVMSGLLFRRPGAALLLAAIACAISLFAFATQPTAPFTPQVAMVHQVMRMTTIWLTALLVFSNRKSFLRLATAQARLQQLVSGLNIGEWDWDVLADRLTWSPRYCEMLGLPAQDPASYREVATRLHPDDVDPVAAHMRAHLEEHLPFNIEYRLRRQNGNYAWIHATGQASWDDKGRAVQIVGSAQDITERKLAEERFQKIVDFAPYPIIVIDNEGAILLTNRQAETLFQYSRDELERKNVELLIPRRFRSLHPAHRHHYFTSQASHVQETRPMGLGRELFALRKDGSEVPVEIGLIPISDVLASYVLCTIVDITARVAAEAQTRRFQDDLKRQVAERTAQLAASNRELEDFAYAASHDLKTPLRAINHTSLWLMEDLEEHLTSETREHLNLLRSRVENMEKLLDGLLEYARIRHSGVADSSETVAGDVLLRDILSLLAPPATFQITVEGAFSKASFQRMPLQQVLMNLIGNAIKHHDKPAGRISICLSDTGPTYSFAVCDDGPGIPKRLQAKAFRMFQTLKPRDNAEGSGMGLAIVRKHVESAGGQLTLESAPGSGCIFRFTWPKPVSRPALAVSEALV